MKAVPNVTTVTPGSWKDIETRLEAALRLLPVWQPSDGEALSGISYATLIPGIVRELAHMRPTSAGTPRNEAASRAATERELADIVKRASALSKTLQALHKPAIEVLNFRPSALSALKTHLAILTSAALHADVSNVSLNAGRGRPVKAHERKVARRVAEHFYGITGKLPTRTVSGKEGAFGPFVHLLTTVYETLGIDADPDGHAREAIEFMEKSFPKSHD